MRVFTAILVAAIVLTAPLLLGGCPSAGPINGPPVANERPVANAGPNQTVHAGDTVSLFGTASRDPEGATLTYAWSQATGGVVVPLAGADTATPTFTAPAITGTIAFDLAVSDGKATASDRVIVGIDVVPDVTPLLFIANAGGNNIVSYDISSANYVSGNMPPSANLAGDQTRLSGPTDMVVSKDGSLLVANSLTKAITAYLDAHDLAGIRGNVAPARTVQGTATALDSPLSLAVGIHSDNLYVLEIAPAKVVVFANASTDGFSGGIAPARTLTSKDMTAPAGMYFGLDNTLYVVNGGAASKIAVFDRVDILDGAVAATRVITSPAFVDPSDVFVDASVDRLFVVDRGGNQIHVFEGAATCSGNRNPDVTLKIPGAQALAAIAVDANGVGYITDRDANAIYSYESIGTRNGTFTPDRTLRGASTQLNAPCRMFLLQ